MVARRKSYPPTKSEGKSDLVVRKIPVPKDDLLPTYTDTSDSEAYNNDDQREFVLKWSWIIIIEVMLEMKWRPLCPNYRSKFKADQCSKRSLSRNTLKAPSKKCKQSLLLDLMNILTYCNGVESSIARFLEIIVLKKWTLLKHQFQLLNGRSTGYMKI